jgi:hypothetical protein
VKRNGKYGRNVGWIVKWYGKYGRKVSYFSFVFSTSFHYLTFLFFRNVCTKSVSLRFSVFRMLTDFVCLYNYEFWLSLCKIVRSSVILLLRKIWKKRRLNSEMIWKIWKKSKLKCEMIWKIWKKSKLNSEKIGKIWKKDQLKYFPYHFTVQPTFLSYFPHLFTI